MYSEQPAGKKAERKWRKRTWGLECARGVGVSTHRRPTRHGDCVFGPGWPVICAIAICQPGKCSTEWHAKCSQWELVVAASSHLCVCSCQKCHHGHGLESDWLWHGRLLLSFLGHTFSLELPIGCTRHRKRGGKEEEKEDRFDMAKCHQLPAEYECVCCFVVWK